MMEPLELLSTRLSVGPWLSTLRAPNQHTPRVNTTSSS